MVISVVQEIFSKSCASQKAPHLILVFSTIPSAILHKIPSYVIEDNSHKFVVYELAKIRYDCELSSGWPDEENLQKLTCTSATQTHSKPMRGKLTKGCDFSFQLLSERLPLKICICGLNMLGILRKDALPQIIGECPSSTIQYYSLLDIPPKGELVLNPKW